MGDKDAKAGRAAETIFQLYSRGAETGRDEWVYNFSQSSLTRNMQQMIAVYNGEVKRFSMETSEKTPDISDLDRIVDNDPKKISWTRNLKNHALRLTTLPFRHDAATLSLYRPFSKQWLYLDLYLNNYVSHWLKIFPNTPPLSKTMPNYREDTKIWRSVLPESEQQPDSRHSWSQQCRTFSFNSTDSASPSSHSSKPERDESGNLCDWRGGGGWIYGDHDERDSGFEYAGSREPVLSLLRLRMMIGSGNLAICVSGVGATIPFSTTMVATVPDLEVVSKSQCFSLYSFQNRENESESAMTASTNNYFSDRTGTTQSGDLQRKENITDASLTAFRAHYKDEAIEKEDIFFYTYGILHSPEYRKRFADNLRRQLPRIPFAPDFWAFNKAGEKLAELHVEYEQVEPWPLDELGTENEPKDEAERKRFYRVEQMNYGGKSRDKDKTVLHYNSRITLTGIPPEAHEYIVNGKPALDWLVERYAIKEGKQSGLLNDPNEWSDDPRYILDLVKRVTRVAVETVHIVRSLPPLE